MEVIVNTQNFWRPLLAVFLCFLIGQGSKIFLDFRKHKKARILENGGMPSGHTAITTGLAVTIFLETGLSLLFLMSCVFAAIVINDAIGVRRETTRHSLFLNDLIKKKQFIVVGHEPREVFFGALIGFVVPVLVYAFLVA